MKTQTALKTHGNVKHVKLPQPHSKQLEFIASPAKFRAFIAGIGSGKTLIGCCEMLAFAIKNPGSLNMVTAPTYVMLRDATLRTFFDVCPESLIREYKRGSHELQLTNGSEIIFRSCDDPERLRGPNLASWFGDEAALYSSMVWKIMLGRLRQTGFDSRAWITSTPKGFNWIHKEFVEQKRPEYEMIHCSTLDNPYLKEDFKHSLLQSYTGVFAKQEIYGDFVGFEGLVFPMFSRQIHEVNLQYFHEGNTKGIYIT